LNIIYLIGVLSAFNATLTLPGIAGIILAIGMAVDSNVLMFERIREELRVGKTPRAAIDSGYNKAFWTIFDSHVTTLITAVILFQFGTGPIKGFAVTLGWGVFINLFTALVGTKTFFDLITTKWEIKKLSI
jgi:preprotein translocase subunit SecD